ncbi:MAG: VWA domain-containing protein [Acidobacteriota bacterium]
MPIGMSRIGVAVALVALMSGESAGQVIRSSADLISIDVQVVDRDGNPITGLTRDQFSVQIEGKPRPVSVLDFVRADTRDVATSSSLPSATVVAPGVALAAPSGSERKQTYMVLVDAQSFSAGVSRGIATAAQNFVRALPPTAVVGLLTYPLGPKVEPTTDHVAVIGALDQVSGQKEPDAVYRYNVRPSEVVDWFAKPELRLEISNRYCGAYSGGPASRAVGAGDGPCGGVLSSEMSARAGLGEIQGRVGLSMLRDLLVNMGSIEGRKIAVLASAGLTMSDAPGGRPDFGTLPSEVGEAAARSNVSVYTLFVDNNVLELFSAERREAVKSQVNLARDAEVMARWLGQFAGASGGAFMKVLTGNGEYAFGRIVRETSAYYLLGIDATDADRTGHAQRIKVRVAQKGATVRSREFVVIPKRPVTLSSPSH